MFHKAVICTDLSEASDALIECAGHLHLLGVREIVLAHVADAFAAKPFDLMREGIADDAFLRQLAALEACDFTVHIDAAISHPAYSLQELVERHEAQLIVMASESRDACGRALAGSGGPNRVTALGTAVLAVTTPFLAEDGGRSCARLLAHVLFVTDLTWADSQALHAVHELVGLGARTLTVLHVRNGERPDGGEDQEAAEAARLGAIKADLLQRGATLVHPLVVGGARADAVAARMAEHRYSLVVVRTPSTRAIAGGKPDLLSERLLHESHAPVLLVPPHLAEEAEVA